MSQVRPTQQWLQALDEDDGAVKPINENGYVTLGVDTYFFPVGIASDASALAILIQTDGTIAGTFTFEATCAPKTGPGSSADWDDSSTSPWVVENSVINGGVQTNGTGWTATVFSLAKTAGIGCALLSLSGRGAHRFRVRADISTGGTVRVAASGKS